MIKSNKRNFFFKLIQLIVLKIDDPIPERGEWFTTLKEKMESFWPKSWVTGGSKIRPRIPSNWRIFESNWLHIESQIVIWSKFSSSSDSTFKVKMTFFFFQCTLLEVIRRGVDVEHRPGNVEALYYWSFYECYLNEGIIFFFIGLSKSRTM